MAVGTVSVGTVRHPESIVLKRVESAGAGSPVMRPSSEGVCDLPAWGAGFCTSYRFCGLVRASAGMQDIVATIVAATAAATAL